MGEFPADPAAAIGVAHPASDRQELLDAGCDAKVVQQVVALTDRAECTRRQSAIGPKISQMPFGCHRRLSVSYRPAG